MFQSPPNFFGLPSNYRQIVLNEEFFRLLYHMKGAFSYQDLWGISRRDRVWYLQRLQDQFELEKKAIDEAGKGKR